jgi:hypothetical protein
LLCHPRFDYEILPRLVCGRLTVGFAFDFAFDFGFVLASC